MKTLVLSLVALCMVSAHAADTWDDVRFQGVVTQQLDNSCGLGSLLTIMQHHFGDTKLDERSLLRAYFEKSSETAIADAMRNGLSLLELAKLSQEQGYETRLVTPTLPQLRSITRITPALVYLEIGSARHFAVVRGVTEYVVFLADSSRGNIEYSHAEFLREWRGAALHHAGAALLLLRDGVRATNFLEVHPSETSESLKTLLRASF